MDLICNIKFFNGASPKPCRHTISSRYVGSKDLQIPACVFCFRFTRIQVFSILCVSTLVTASTKYFE